MKVRKPRAQKKHSIRKPDFPAFDDSHKALRPGDNILKTPGNTPD